MISRLREHPLGFWFVFWGELAERASFYGMKTLLVFYLVTVYHYSRGQSGATVEYFTAAAYLLCIPGGVIADRWLGKYRTIVYFSIPYILGHIILGKLIGHYWLLTALALLAAGSGTIKPNTSTIMGLIYEKEGKEHLLTEAFSYYYAAVNIGAAVSSIGLPVVQLHYAQTSGSQAYGYEVALMYPTILMAIAFVVFVFGKKYYPTEEISREVKTVEERAEERDTILRLSGVFLLIAVFWFVYDQQGSTWILFADSNMDLWLRPFNIHVTAAQMQGLNPVLIVVLTPIFNWMWEAIRRRRGEDLPDTHKMMIGFVLVIACMGTMAVAGFLSRFGPVSIWYNVLATIIITMAELCVSVVGLEFSFRQASVRMRSTIVAFFWLTVFVGDFIGGLFVEQLYDALDKGLFFAIQTGIITAATVAFFYVGRSFRRRERAGKGPEPVVYPADA